MFKLITKNTLKGDISNFNEFKWCMELLKDGKAYISFYSKSDCENFSLKYDPETDEIYYIGAMYHGSAPEYDQITPESRKKVLWKLFKLEDEAIYWDSFDWNVEIFL